MTRLCLLPLLLLATPALGAGGITPSTTARPLGTLGTPLRATRTVETAPVLQARQPYGYGTVAPRVVQQQPYHAQQPQLNQPSYEQHIAYTHQNAPAPDQLDTLVFGGTEFSGHNGKYGNIGAIGAVGDGATIGNGPVWRVMTDALGYSYVGGPANSDIDGTAVAGEAAVGYMHSFGSRASIAGYVGGIYRYTDLDPNDPGNKLQGGRWGLKTQAEGTFYATPDWRTGIQAAYVFGPDSWWARGNTQYRLFNSFFIGPEATVQGDNTYTAWQAGALVNGFKISDYSEFGIRAGYKKIENLNGTIYGGAEFSTMF